MTSGPAIWLGDAIRVAAALGADAETVTRVQVLLGLRPAEEPAPDRRAPVSVPLPSRPDTRPPEPPAAPAARDYATHPHLEADEPARPRVERLEPRPPATPAILPELSAVLEKPPPRLPPRPTDLFHHDRQRAVLTSLCSGPAPTGEPDLDAAVEIAARGEPLLTLPAEIRPTTRRGLQLLIDRGDAMLPFLRDQERVLHAIAALTGPDGLEVVHFARTPLDPPGAGSGPLWTWQPYRPQLPGQPVLVLSDLGALVPLGERSDVEDRWCRFAALLQEAGCPLTALVPALRQRVPARVRSAIAIVPWDRPTGVREAVAAARRAGGRLPRGSR